MPKASNAIYQPLSNVPWNSLEMEALTWLTAIAPHWWAWLCSAHGCFQRQSFSQIRLATPELAISLYAVVDNHSVLSMSWPDLQNRRLPSCEAYNDVRGITVMLLTEVCHGVTTEPHLYSHFQVSPCLITPPCITENSAQLDVTMYGFWGGRFEKVFIDVRVFNPSAQSNWHGPLSSVYHKHK